MNLQIEFKRYRNTLALLLLFIGVASTAAQAQRRSEEEIKKIQDAKVAIITNRLNLTPEQSTDFWPMYNEYSQKRREIHRAQRKIINDKKAEGQNDESVLNNLKEVQELRQKELDLEKEYQNKFLKVITASQVIELYKAERTFNDMLIQRLKQKN
ncbi:LTXXQ motif family protein [Dyadobacter jiangsuensis]|uniref:LTXXQ motif family protein n=1 Tax=Dyadobacter jiangsuensis TaxID=1591085 RepID=A0A2P8FY58_9BACT|nr:LTXXQ motif family protein [Dyadobacter jiangsuensis]